MISVSSFQLRTLRSAAAAAAAAAVLLPCTMYSGEDGEVCVELGYVGGKLSALKATKPDKSKVGGLPVRLSQKWHYSHSKYIPGT